MGGEGWGQGEKQSLKTLVGPRPSDQIIVGVQNQHVRIRHPGAVGDPSHLRPVLGPDPGFRLVSVAKQQEMRDLAFLDNPAPQAIAYPGPDRVAKQDSVLISHLIRATAQMENTKALSPLNPPLSDACVMACGDRSSRSLGCREQPRYQGDEENEERDQQPACQTHQLSGGAGALDGQPDCERATLAQSGFHLNGAAMILDDAVRDRESQTGSGHLPASQWSFGCHERLEELV